MITEKNNSDLQRQKKHRPLWVGWAILAVFARHRSTGTSPVGAGYGVHCRVWCPNMKPPTQGRWWFASIG
jgi:hypothetical protein